MKIIRHKRLLCLLFLLPAVAGASWLLASRGIAQMLRPDFRGFVEIGDAEALEMAMPGNTDLLLATCDPKVDGYLPIHHAARTGNVDMLKLLIAKGSPLSRQDAFGWTPLHYAVIYERVSAEKLLIHAGAGWDQTSRPDPNHNLCRQLFAHEEARWRAEYRFGLMYLNWSSGEGVTDYEEVQLKYPGCGRTVASLPLQVKISGQGRWDMSRRIVQRLVTYDRSRGKDVILRLEDISNENAYKSTLSTMRLLRQQSDIRISIVDGASLGKSKR